MSTLFEIDAAPKAISLTQPWAMLAVLQSRPGVGEKQFETRGRTWRKSHPPEIYIHASKGFPKDVREFCRKNGLPDTLKELCKAEPFRSALARHGWEVGEHLPTGAIIGKVRVVRSWRVEEVRDEISAQERAFGNYSDGRTAIELACPQLFDVWIRCGGALGLWKVPADVAASIRAQSERAA
jgi:hypothetical protein